MTLEEYETRIDAAFDAPSLPVNPAGVREDNFQNEFFGFSQTESLESLVHKIKSKLVVYGHAHCKSTSDTKIDMVREAVRILKKSFGKKFQIDETIYYYEGNKKGIAFYMRLEK